MNRLLGSSEGNRSVRRLAAALIPAARSGSIGFSKLAHFIFVFVYILGTDWEEGMSELPCCNKDQFSQMRSFAPDYLAEGPAGAEFGNCIGTCRRVRDSPRHGVSQLL